MDYDKKYVSWSEGYDEGYAKGVVAAYAEGKVSLDVAKAYLKGLDVGFHSGYRECINDHQEEIASD